jgi:hypothetical protein
VQSPAFIAVRARTKSDSADSGSSASAEPAVESPIKSATEQSFTRDVEVTVL